MTGKGKIENLTPGASVEEAREMGRKGGKASGVARRKRKTICQSLELLLERVEQGEDEERTGVESVAMALYRKALGGDVKAMEVLRDTVGEKPTTALSGKVESALSGGVVVKWQD